MINSVSRLIASVSALIGIISGTALPGHIDNRQAHRTTGGEIRQLKQGAPRTVPKNKATESDRAQVSTAYGKLPLRFEANEGQLDSRVKFVSRFAGYALYLTSTGAVLQLRPSDKSDERDKSRASTGSMASNT